MDPVRGMILGRAWTDGGLQRQAAAAGVGFMDIVDFLQPGQAGMAAYGEGGASASPATL
jgi:hypothetical protein